MIDRKDVIYIRIQYPPEYGKGARLYLSPHMYICIGKTVTKRYFVKCQTMKNKLVANNGVITRYVEEKPDPSRNPFEKTTLIDCDKRFESDGVFYDLAKMQPSRRRRHDVCDDIVIKIDANLQHGDYEVIVMDTIKLCADNPQRVRSLIKSFSTGNSV